MSACAVASLLDASPLLKFWQLHLFHKAASHRLPIQSATSNVQNQRLALAVDGDPETRWDSGPQRGVEVVTVDPGMPRTVDGLTMTIGRHLADFPLTFALPHVPARLLRLRQLGKDPVFYWTIFELAVFG